MTTQRPQCVHCGKLYGSRATTSERVRWEVGEQPPPYRGNGIVIKEVGQGYQTATRATVRDHTMLSINPEIRARQEADLARLPETSCMVGHRSIWDGETWWGGCKPFCTLRCALDYARKAYARSQQPELRRVR
jgi:hypothetical protein